MCNRCGLAKVATKEIPIMNTPLSKTTSILLLLWIVAAGASALESGVTNETLEGKSIEGETIEGETAEGETVEGEAVEGEAAEGELTEGEIIEGEAVEATIVIPNVSRKPLETARTLIEGHSLTLGTVSHECNNMLAEGMVVRQFPAPGTLVAEQVPVDLVVSTGRCPLGCDSYGLEEWGLVFLAALAFLTLLTLGLFIGEGGFVNPFDILR